MLIHAIHAIVGHGGAYETAKVSDPITGEYQVRKVMRTLAPGQIHDLPTERACDLIARGAARELTETEVNLWRLGNGHELLGPGR